MVIESGMQMSRCNKCGNIWNGSLDSVGLSVEIIAGFGPVGGEFAGFLFLFFCLSVNPQVWL